MCCGPYDIDDREEDVELKTNAGGGNDDNQENDPNAGAHDAVKTDAKALQLAAQDSIQKNANANVCFIFNLYFIYFFYMSFFFVCLYVFFCYTCLDILASVLKTNRKQTNKQTKK